MKKVLVTGSTGFIGRQTLNLLIKKGYEVHAIFCNSNYASFNFEFDSSIIWHRCNLLNSNEVNQIFSKIKPTHLMHFAWYAEHGKFWSSEKNIMWLEASLAIVRAFKSNGGMRIIASGTCAEYSWRDNQILLETSLTKPATLYGICKASFHEVLASYAEEQKISYSWGRIFFLYGEGEPNTRLIPHIIRNLLQNQDALCSHGNQLRDFLHVQDVAQAFVDIMDSEIMGPINISSGVPISIKDVGNLIHNNMNTKGKIIYGASEASPDDPPLIVGDNSRLKNELSWNQSISLSEGIKGLIDYQRELLKV